MSTPEDPYAPPPGYGTPQGYGAPVPGWSPVGQAQATNTKAVIALVLAIAAYLPVVPFVGAIVALFLVRSARREIYASGGRQAGLGICTAAKVIAVVHLVLVALLFLAFLAVIAVGLNFS